MAQGVLSFYTSTPAICSWQHRCNNKARATITVSNNKVNRLRLINAATLVYMTVCFEKHDVTVVALDAAPVEPRTFEECVDINSGQRYVRKGSSRLRQECCS